MDPALPSTVVRAQHLGAASATVDAGVVGLTPQGEQHTRSRSKARRKRRKNPKPTGGGGWRVRKDKLLFEVKRLQADFLVGIVQAELLAAEYESTGELASPEVETPIAQPTPDLGTDLDLEVELPTSHMAVPFGRSLVDLILSDGSSALTDVTLSDSEQTRKKVKVSHAGGPGWFQRACHWLSYSVLSLCATDELAEMSALDRAFRKEVSREMAKARVPEPMPEPTNDSELVEALAESVVVDAHQVADLACNLRAKFGLGAMVKNDGNVALINREAAKLLRERFKDRSVVQSAYLAPVVDTFFHDTTHLRMTDWTRGLEDCNWFVRHNPIVRFLCRRYRRPARTD